MEGPPAPRLDISEAVMLIRFRRQAADMSNVGDVLQAGERVFDV